MQTHFPKIEKLLRAAKGEGEAASDEALKCLWEDREVPGRNNGPTRSRETSLSGALEKIG
jgi:hypothetical protein